LCSNSPLEPEGRDHATDGRYRRMGRQIRCPDPGSHGIRLAPLTKYSLGKFHSFQIFQSFARRTTKLAKDPARRSRNRISDYLPQRRKGRKEKEKIFIRT